MSEELKLKGTYTKNPTEFGSNIKSRFHRDKRAKQVLNDEQYLRFKGFRPACRITVPCLNTKHIRDAAIQLRLLAKELDRVQRNTSLTIEDRVKMAQWACTSASHKLKYASQHGDDYREGGYRGVK